MSTKEQSGSRFPLPDWLRAYQPEWLRLDVVSGLTAAAVVIPKAMAYATIAGLRVEVGLYTAFLPMVIYAALGTSRPLSVSTATTLAILSAAALGLAVPGGDAAALMTASVTLALMVGVILVAASILRLGFVADFISEPVLTGFKAGIGLVIVLDQVPKLLGIHFDKGSFFHNLASIVQALPESSMAIVAVGGLTMVVLIAFERFFPRAPAPLVAVAGAIAAVSLLGLPDYGVSTVGEVPTGLPSLTLPDFSLFAQLWPAALGIALMSFTETIAAGRAFARPGEPFLQPNRELLATGIANAGGALLGSMPAGGGTSQTAVNRFAGARTQAAGLVTASAALLTMLLLAPFIALMPHATLAVVIVYSIGLIKPAEFRAIASVRRTEFVWALVALAGVLLLGTLQGILVAIVVSLVAMAAQVADPPVHVLGRKPGTNVFRPRTPEHPEDETFPGLLMLRPEGRVFFANAERIAQKIQPLIEAEKPRVVALDLKAVLDLEYTALKILTEAEERQRRNGVELRLVGLNPVVLEMVQSSPLGLTLARDRMFFNLEQAVALYQSSSASLSAPPATLHPQLGERAGQGGVGRSDLLVGDLFAKPRLGPKARLFGPGLVDVLRRDGHVGEDGYAARRDLHQAPAHGKKLRAPGPAHDELPGRHLGHEADVLGKDTHLSLDPGQRHHLHVVGVSASVRRHDLESQGVGHVQSGLTSSIPPFI
jgi:high affinity sulfate transporter 1